MYSIDYEITLNDRNRPCIKLSDDYIDKAEDKFFAFELTRYVLQNIFEKRGDVIKDVDAEKIETSINLLGQLSDEMAMILWDNMKNRGKLYHLMKNVHNMVVDKIEDLEKIPEINICYKDRIYDDRSCLRILVEEDSNIYMFVNDNWKTEEDD